MSADHADVPIPNSYWVLPSQFLAGEYPGIRDPQDTLKKLIRFIDRGVHVFIDLTQYNEAQPYSLLLQKISTERNVKIIYRRRGVPDFSIPSINFMKETLNMLDEFIETGKIVYVHCLGGVGRTGTVVGCYLVRHGRSPQEALDWLTHLRRDTPDWWYPSPESPAQKEMILKWKIGQ
jgi:hypothetical protein